LLRLRLQCAERTRQEEVKKAEEEVSLCVCVCVRACALLQYKNMQNVAATFYITRLVYAALNY